MQNEEVLGSDDLVKEMTNSEAELLQLYKDLDQRILTMDAMLTGLALGVSGWVEIDSRKWGDGDTITKLGFGKYNREWSLLVDEYDDWREDDEDSHNVRPLVESAVDIKVKAVAHFTELVTALVASLKSRVKSVRAAVKKADKELIEIHDLLTPKAK